MTTHLPGSNSGKAISLTVTKAVFRLVGGSDLADAIADLTGLSARKVKSLAREGAQRLHESGQVEHELRGGPTGDYSAMESAIVSAFRRAVERDEQAVPVAALTSVDDLVETVSDAALRREVGDWSEDEAAYAVALTRQVAQLCRAWYLDDPTARGFATAAGVGQVLKGQSRVLSGQQEALSILRKHFGATVPTDPDAATQALEQALADGGWAWTPVRAGGAGGLDGFMTPTDETGAFLPLQVPVRLVRGRIRTGPRGELFGPHVSRDDVALLRAHVPSGYFAIYSEAADALYFAPATRVAEVFNRGEKNRDRVRVMRSDLVDATALGVISSSLRGDRQRLVEALAAPGLREPAVRLYQTLSSAHHVLFEFIATLAFVDPENLLLVHHQWANGVAEGGRHEDDYLHGIVTAMNEYEVTPPVELLKDFPGASLMLTVMRSVIDQLDTITSTLETDSPGITDQLGVPGLRATVAGAIKRSYRRTDGARLPVNTPDDEKPSWLALDAGHYFMSVAQVALVVDRLVHSIRGVVLPPVAGSTNLTPRPTWIRHRAGPDR